MKKVIAILALIALTGNIASAELLKNFKAGGSIEVNGYQVQNGTDYNDNTNDKINDTEVRVTVGATFDLNDDAYATVTAVKNNGQYDGSAQNTAANDTINAFNFMEANIFLKGVFGFDHRLGKQYYGEQGDLIVYYGPRNWPYTVGLNFTGTQGLDGWTGWYETGKWNLHGIYGKDTDSVATPNVDQDLTGIVAKYDMSDDMKLGGYLYQYNTQGGAAPHDRIQVLGVKANGMFAGFNYKAEIAKNMGRNNGTLVNTAYAGALTDNSYEGMALLANASYEMDMAGKLTLMGEFGMGTGDDNGTDDKVEAFYGIQSDYRPGILWGGYGLFNSVAATNVTNAGLTNLTTWNVGAKWAPESMEKLTLKAKLFNFAPTEDTGLTYDAYGTEFDLCANWQHSEDVGVKAYYAMFMPEKEYADIANDNTNDGDGTDDMMSMLGVAFNVKF